MDIAGKPIELGDNQASFLPLRCSEGGDKFRPLRQGISSLARLNLDMLPDQVNAIGCNVSGDGVCDPEL